MGTTIGPYDVLGQLGRGGMGVVLRARERTGREVAVKLVRRPSAESLARFERERRLLASFTEADGFVPLLATGDCTEGPWFAMPLLDGGTLRDRLERGPLPIDEAISLGVALAAALGRAHARGVVHRDVKPENVLYAEGARPLLADLGLARHFASDSPGASRSVALSRSGEMRGTAGYMSPEQARDARSVGPPADVFALGAVLHECLSGEPAFAGASILEVFRAVEENHPTPLAARRPETPAWLATVVARALARDQEDRYPDGAALEAALRAGAFGRASGRAPTSRRARLAGVAVASALLGGALVLAAYGVRFPLRGAPTPGPAATTAPPAPVFVPSPRTSVASPVPRSSAASRLRAADMATVTSFLADLSSASLDFEQMAGTPASLVARASWFGLRDDGVRVALQRLGRLAPGEEPEEWARRIWDMARRGRLACRPRYGPAALDSTAESEIERNRLAVAAALFGGARGLGLRARVGAKALAGDYPELVPSEPLEATPQELSDLRARHPVEAAWFDVRQGPSLAALRTEMPPGDAAIPLMEQRIQEAAAELARIPVTPDRDPIADEARLLLLSAAVRFRVELVHHDASGERLLAARAAIDAASAVPDTRAGAPYFLVSNRVAIAGVLLGGGAGPLEPARRAELLDEIRAAARSPWPWERDAAYFRLPADYWAAREAPAEGRVRALEEIRGRARAIADQDPQGPLGAAARGVALGCEIDLGREAEARALVDGQLHGGLPVGTLGLMSTGHGWLETVDRYGSPR